ncbi:MAG: Bax inhibitor-1/YccA family protein [Myxococcota bacterium]|nr:Bax inhibitor-1/YccA family protein [Myxococcota bacterium]
MFGGQAVSQLSRTQQMSFLQRVYMWMAGGLVLAGVGSALSIQTGVAEAMLRSGMMGHLLILGLWWGVAYYAQKVQFQPTVNTIAFAVYSLLTGLVMSDLILIALIIGAQTQGSAGHYIYQAFGLTAVAFGGLSYYATKTDRDFSFMGGIITVGIIAAIGLSLMNFFIESSVLGMAISFGVVLLMAGSILWNTQRILQTSPPNGHIGAALVLFTDFAVMFMHILSLLLQLASGGRD